MTTILRSLVAPAIALSLTLAAAPFGTAAFAQATSVQRVVNKEPVTTFDIQRRAAFLKLQRRSGSEAEQDLIDQVLRSQEMARLKINVPEKQVEESFGRFAASNKLQPAQMDQILEQAGVGKKHFREFMRVQIGWGQALGQRQRSEGRVTEQDVVKRIKQDGGRKPSATEYILQQVIFVVPAAERGKILARRKQEANALRARFAGCDGSKAQAKGILDVTVRNLGRVLEPELPEDWSKQVKATQQGGVTEVRETDRGIEFLAVCHTKQVSNDRVAQLVFSAELDAGKQDGGDALSKKYTKELRDRAQIVKP